MAKKQFEQNLDSKFIQFRIKPGEKREIYEYAVNHGFTSISSYIKHLIWGDIRGIGKEERENNFTEFMELTNEQIKLQEERLQKQDQIIELLLEKLDKEDNNE